MADRKVAVVTGAGRGIGSATAIQLSEEGYFVYLVSRTRNELEQTRAGLSSPGELVVCDLAKENEVNALFDRVEEEQKRLDVLVNNGAVILNRSFEETTLTDWDQVLNVNLRGLFQCSQRAFRLMKRQGSGSIINISSLGGVKSTQKFPGFSAYTTSKAAVIGFSEAIAVEAAPEGVRVACVAPGAVNTAMLQKAAPGLKSETSPEQVARLVVYLATESAEVPLNGSVVEVHSNV